MKLTDAADFLYDKAVEKGVKVFDIVGGISESTGLEIFESKVQNTEISYGSGIGIRIFNEGRPGISFTEKLSSQSLIQTLEDAISNSEITDAMELELPEKQSIHEFDLKIYDPGVNQVSFESMIHLGLELEKIAKSKDVRVENVPYLGVSKSESFSVFRNSKGVSFDRKSNSASAYVGVTASQGEQKKMGFYSNSYKSFSEFNPEFMAGEAVTRATELLGASSVQGGMYPVVFSNRVSPSIIGMFLSPYFAEVVQKGQSRLTGKVGEKISSENFSILLDPHIEGMPGSRLYDGEGVPTEKLDLVSNGKLNTFLYNLESAHKDKVKPTGHGSRSYAGKAGTGVSNLFVKKGESTLTRLLRAYPECIYITRLEGGSGCSAISGDISIGVQGFLYQNGIRIRPLDKITLSGNYFDVLHKIEDLSNEYSDSYSSMKVPDILISQMTISG